MTDQGEGFASRPMCGSISTSSIPPLPSGFGSTALQTTKAMINDQIVPNSLPKYGESPNHSLVLNPDIDTVRQPKVSTFSWNQDITESNLGNLESNLGIDEKSSSTSSVQIENDSSESINLVNDSEDAKSNDEDVNSENGIEESDMNKRCEPKVSEYDYGYTSEPSLSESQKPISYSQTYYSSIETKDAKSEVEKVNVENDTEESDRNKNCEPKVSEYDHGDTSEPSLSISQESISSSSTNHKRRKFKLESYRSIHVEKEKKDVTHPRLEEGNPPTVLSPSSKDQSICCSVF